LALASLILSIAAIYIILGSQYLYEELVLRRSQQPHVRTVEQKTAANSLPSDKPSAFAISDAVAVPVLPSGAMVQPKHFEESDRTKFELPRRMYKFSSLNLLLASVLFAVLGTGAILTNHAQEKSPGLITIEQASRQVKQLDCTKVDKGDFNCDGKIDYLDVSALLIKVNSEDSKSDLNHNGKVDTADVTTVTKNLSR
jgi:hypothetical protein